MLSVDEFEEQPTVLEQFKRAWMNEKSCTDLLEYKADLLEQLTELIQEQIDRIYDLPADAKSACGSIMQLQVERVKFTIRSYLRTRLGKIEKYARYFLQEKQYHSRMHSTEIEYAQKYVGICNQLLNDTVLMKLPETLRRLNDNYNGIPMSQFIVILVEKPDLSSAVLARITSDYGAFPIAPEIGLVPVLSKNSLLVTRYNKISELVADGTAQLF